MADEPSQETKDQTAEPPAPEVLKPQADDEPSPPKAADASDKSGGSAKPASPATPKVGKRSRRGPYRPSHKATFIGLAVAVAILAVNAVIIGFVVKSQDKSGNKANEGQVTISQAALDKLGVNRTPVGDKGIELVVNPDARFAGKVQVGGDLSIAGQLKLNGKFSAADANLAQLEAGNTSLSQLNVNGNSTLSNVNLRNDLSVTGVTRLQGTVTITQLLTVNNSANISGSLSVGGTLAVSTLHTGSLVADSSLTIGGHVITRGSAPGASSGPAVGSNGTVSISGNDAAGTVAVNVGAGAGGGILANVSFNSSYSGTPHVVITPIGAGVGSVYVNRSSRGFSIGVSGGLSPGGYAFDYIVEQ